MASTDELWSTIATVSYGSFYLVLLILISCSTYSSDLSKTKWLSLIWKKRNIYAPLLVHIYDTATDIGVVYIWGSLALSKEDIAYIDIMTFFILGLVFIALYRLFSLVSVTFILHFLIVYF